MNIEEKVLSECDTKECNGTFYVIDDCIKECKCFKKLIRYSRYDKARIPNSFWNFTKEDIVKDFKKSILNDYDFFKNNIHECMENKVDFLFYGTVGTGKTTIAIMMLKDILDAGYKGMLLTGFEVIDYVYTDRKNELDECDFLVIDESDKVMKKTVDDFCNIISSYLGKKSIILLTNLSIEKLQLKGYPEFFLDRLRELEIVEFSSKSIRGQLPSKFKKTKSK